MKKYMLGIMCFCFILCGVVLMFEAQEDFVVVEDKKQSIYDSITYLAQERQKFIIQTPKILFRSSDYPKQWWQGEAPLTFAKRKGDIIIYDKNPCSSLGKYIKTKRFISYFLNDAYKPKKIFGEDTSINVGKGSFFAIDIPIYDYEENMKLTPSEQTNLECGAIVFDNRESMPINFEEIQEGVSAITYYFSDTNNLKYMKEKMKNSKKYYIEIVLSKEINSKTQYFKGRWFFGDWDRK